MSLRAYLKSFDDLPVADAHSAQLAGAAEAYFPQRKGAYQRHLRVAHDVLTPNESVVAAFPSSIERDRRVGVRTGLLIVTNDRLIHVAAGVMRRRPRLRSIAVSDIQRIELTETHPVPGWLMRCSVCGEVVVFGFTPRDKKILGSVRHTMRRLTHAPLLDRWTSIG
jgi:hypothetical protein